MNITHIHTFLCSLCGEPIPDTDLKLVIIRTEERKPMIICPACLAEEEVQKRREAIRVKK